MVIFFLFDSFQFENKHKFSYYHQYQFSSLLSEHPVKVKRLHV